jgi:hypothetical protein
MQKYRQMISKQARGFILAAPTLPSGPKLDRALEVAHLIATLDHRQSINALVRAVHSGMFFPTPHLTISLVASCLCTDAVG